MKREPTATRRPKRKLATRTQLGKQLGLDPKTVETRLGRAGVRPVHSTYVGSRGYDEYDEAEALAALATQSDVRDIENETRLLRAKIKDLKRGLRSGELGNRRAFAADLGTVAAEYRLAFMVMARRMTVPIAELFRDQPGRECRDVRLIPLTPELRGRLLSLVREELDGAAAPLRALLEKYSEVKP